MKYIQKGKEPVLLASYRASANRSSTTLYDDYPYKDGLRQQLLQEQGCICCYCMQRISDEIDRTTGQSRMKIEHWAPQSIYDGQNGKPDRCLDYSNLLGACRGNEGQPSRLHHCDSRKGDTEIKINPTLPICEQQIYYSFSGEILSNDPDITEDLNETLNLNMQTLRNNRKACWDAIKGYLMQKIPRGTWTKTLLEREAKALTQLNPQGQHKEYFAFLVFLLNQKVAQAK